MPESEIRRPDTSCSFIEKNWKIDLPETPVIPATADNDGYEEERAMESSGKNYAKPSERELKEKLSPIQYKVTQQCGTEPAFRNAYWDNHAEGIYVDVVTGEPLFSSKDKFNSGTGWPSFTRPIKADAVKKQVDDSYGMQRDEVRSAQGPPTWATSSTTGRRPRASAIASIRPRSGSSRRRSWRRRATGEYLKLFAGTVKH